MPSSWQRTESVLFCASTVAAVAARRVGEGVAGAGRGDLDAHGAAVEGLAGAVRGVDLLLATQHLARGGVHIAEQPAGRAVLLAPGGGHLPGEPRLGGDGVDHQQRGRPRRAQLRDRPGRGRVRQRADLGRRLVEGGADRQVEWGAQRLADALQGATTALVDDDVAADHGQTVHGAGHPHVRGAVRVDDGVDDVELLLHGVACDAGVGVECAERLADDVAPLVALRRGAGGTRGLAAERTGDQGRRGESHQGGPENLPH